MIFSYLYLVKFMQNMISQNQSKSCVLLVCIYNQFGTIITHDYLHSLFKPFGNILKILIFQKNKVWKSFVQYDNCQSANKALKSLDNFLVFNDGSKMNIFLSDRKHIFFHNTNLGGVSYETTDNRKRRATFQDHTQKQSSFSSSQKEAQQKQSTLSSNHIENQFKEIAMENENYQEFKNVWNEVSQKESIHNKSQENYEIEKIQCNETQDKLEKIRKKSKTIVNPHSQQFLIENYPSRVLYIRSLPQYYTNKCLYNIFSNFGSISKIIFIKSKECALVEFFEKSKAIQAKDQLNYAKAQFKVFYSRYETLTLRKTIGDEQLQIYNEQNKYYLPNINPPSQVLFLSKGNPQLEEQIRAACENINCHIIDLEWKKSQKTGWMCLLQFYSLKQSLFVMGQLQGMQLSNGKPIKLSFTRSRIQR